MSDWLPWVVALLVVVIVVLALAWWRATTRTARGNRRRQQAASRGESDAERLLADAGYDVVDRQVTAIWWMVVDGEEREVRCRADLLVRDGEGTRFVAEVKTGDRAPDPTHPATRRQLLEYTIAFEVDGVLLVDMEERRIHTVAFPA